MDYPQISHLQMMDRPLAVRCQGVTKTYGQGVAEVAALRGVDLDVSRGELLILMGPSGCGKTTLISIISSVLNADSGQCEVLGHDLRSLGEEEREYFRGHSVGFVFQLFNLLPALTVHENVAVPLLIQGMRYGTAMERSLAVVDAVGLAHRGEALPAQLSIGQQQRVAIARAVVHKPELIVCDEPTSSLDHKTGHEMMNMLRDIVRSEGRTVIVVTHDNRILEFGDRIARMEDGRIVAVDSGSAGERL